MTRHPHGEEITMRTPRATLLLTLLCASSMTLNGCYNWRVQPLPVTTLITARTPGLIRVERADGSRQVLTRPAIVGDSIRGREGSVAATEVTSVHLLRFNPLNTILMTGTAFLGFVTVALALDPISINGLGWRITAR